MKSRSVRRHHDQRIKARVRIRRRRWGDKVLDPRWVGRDAATPHPQQHCMCCCNPRWWEGPTRKELAADLNLRESTAQQ